MVFTEKQIENKSTGINTVWKLQLIAPKNDVVPLFNLQPNRIASSLQGMHYSALIKKGKVTSIAGGWQIHPSNNSLIIDLDNQRIK